MALRRIIYLLSLVGAVVFFWAYRLWFAWFALMVLVCLPIFSLLLSLPAMIRAKLDTSVFRHMPMGTPARLNLFTGKLPALPWRCKLLAQQPLTGETRILRANDAFPTDHSGAWICTVRKAKVYDYLGLFSRTLRHDPQYRLYVQPDPVTSVPPSRNLFSALSWRPKRGGGFAENHELRLYRPGDNVRQIHWKLSAKTGELILRQPMEPVQGQLLLRLDLSGSRSTLDKKLGKLLWLGRYLLRQKMAFRIQALTGNGAISWTVTDAASFTAAFDELLCCPATTEKFSPVLSGSTEWQYYIGGDGDEV